MKCFLNLDTWIKKQKSIHVMKKNLLTENVALQFI